MLTKDVIHYPPAWLFAFQRHHKNVILVACFHTSHGTYLIANLLQSISREPHVCWKRSECSGTLLSGAGYEKICLSKWRRYRTHVEFHGCCHVFRPPYLMSFTSEPDMKKCLATRLIHRTSKHHSSALKYDSLSQFSRLKRTSSSRNVFNAASKIMADEMRLRCYSEEECDFCKTVSITLKICLHLQKVTLCNEMNSTK